MNDALSVMTQRFSRAAEVAVGMLCVAAVVGPLALGATGPWPRFGVEALLAVSAALWAVSCTNSFRARVLPIVISGLFLFQIAPLPDSVLMTLSPAAAGRWSVAREDLPNAWATVSVEPAATAAAIRRLFLGLATVAAVTGLARTPTYRRWFFMALATSAILMWAAAFTFPVNPERREVMGFFNLHGPINFWMAPERGPLQTAGCGYLQLVIVGNQQYLADDAIRGDGFGSYIYSNHFANALCLTLPALWGILMTLAARRKIADAVSLPVLATIIAAALWTTGALAASRAGTASLTFTAVVYLAFAAPSRWLRWPASIVALTGALALIGFVATCQGPMPGVLEYLPATIQTRLVSFLVDTRVLAAKVAGSMFLASPLLGMGLGSYGDLYPMLVPGDRIMFFAHNEYAQFLAESGLLGAGLLVGAAAALGSSFWCFCRSQSIGDRRMDAGAWAAIAGAMAHAVFDWGMHAPANALLACMMLGLALSSVAPRAPHDTTAPATRRRHAGLVLAAGCLAIVPFLARDAFTGHTLDALRRATTAARMAVLKTDAPSPLPLLRRAIHQGSRAARLDAGDWQLAALLAQANLHIAHLTADGQERDRAERAVADWSRRARCSAAVPRGLPEPVTPGSN